MNLVSVIAASAERPARGRARSTVQESPTCTTGSRPHRSVSRRQVLPRPMVHSRRDHRLLFGGQFGRVSHGGVSVPGWPLAVIAEEFDHFVEDPAFVFPAGPCVSNPLPGQHFWSGDFTHLGFYASVTPFLRLQGPPQQILSPASVTFCLSQITLRKKSTFLVDSER